MKLKAREIIRIWTKRKWNYSLISLITIWLHILILTTFSFDCVLIFLGEYWCLSLLGLKGLRKLVHGHQTGSEWISNENKKGIRMNKKGRTKQLQLNYKARKQRKKPSKKRSKGMIREETKGQLRKRTKSRGNSATPTRGELTKAILLVYRRGWWNCACVPTHYD